MMAVAMEVGWRGSELGSPSFSHLKHKAPPANTSASSSWGGADPQKVLQLMMGQIHEESRPTLDLFGQKPSSPAAEAEETQTDEFVELDPDLPLPAGWEKCLDLKSGKVYYVNRHTGAESHSDPSKQAPIMPELQVASASPRTRDFLGSKESENEKLGELSGRPLPSFSGRAAEKEESEPTLFGNGKREKWGHGWLGSGSLSDKLLNEVGGTDNGLELKLNLQGKTQQSSVCTLEKVEMALMRSEKMLGKRVASSSRSSPPQADQLLRNHSAAHVSPSPSTSSSSTSTSSRPSLVGYQVLDKENQNSNKRPAATATAAVSPLVVASEGESAKEMVLVGGCKNCAMFVMLSKSNPSCPHCGTSAALDFPSPLPNKRTKFEADRHD